VLIDTARRWCATTPGRPTPGGWGQSPSRDPVLFGDTRAPVRAVPRGCGRSAVDRWDSPPVEPSLPLLTPTTPHVIFGLHVTRQDAGSGWTGDDLAAALAALANPHRLRLLAALTRRPVHVSELARVVGLSRPLVHMHLQRLEKAGLVEGHLELSEDGKAMKYFEVTKFRILLTPQVVVEAADTLSANPKPSSEEGV